MYAPKGQQRPLMCHHCKVRRVSSTGGDITCSPNCRKGLENAKAAAEKQLQDAGFAKVEGILNLYEKDSVRISIQQVIHAGKQALARHENTVAALR